MSSKAEQIREEEITTGESDLPEGWTMAALGEGLITNVQTGFACGENNREGTGIAHLRPMNVTEEGEVSLRDLKYVPAREADRDERFVSMGDVLFNNTNSAELVGKTAQYGFPEQRAFSNHMTRLRCHPDALNNAYCAKALHHLWRTGYFQQVCNNHVSQASVSRDVLLRTQIPLPPLAEQQRILEKTNNVISQLRLSRTRLEKVPAILKAFRQSVLAAACSGKLTEDWRLEHENLETSINLLDRVDQDRRSDWARTQKDTGKKRIYPEPTRLDSGDLPDIPDGWSWTTLDSIAQEGRPIIYGIIKPGPHIPDGVPYVRVTEMKDGYIDISQLRRTSKERARKFARATLEPGDVLISKDGTIGRVAVVPPELQGGNITQHVMRAPIHRFIEREYIVCALRAPYTQSWLTGELKGVALQGVNVEDFRRLPLPIPPNQEQKEIARRVEALFKLADAIEKRVAAASTRVENLTQAVLAKAFRGELVPTEAELARREGREYEPASVLLEKIEAEKRQGEAQKIGRTSRARAARKK